jgi:hypothetical protein
MGDWGVLDGGASAPAAPAADPAPPRDPAAPGWGRPDGGVVRQRVPSSAPSGSPSPTDVPPPEATASLLRAGEHLWAKVDQHGAVLGSGQRLRLPDAVPDDLYGWRRVQILEPALLSAAVVPIPWDELEAGVGDDPDALYHPEPSPDAGTPARTSAFPVGAGPDLQRLFADRVAESVRDQRDRADRAEQAANRRAELAEQAAAEASTAAERSARERIRVAETRADAAEHAAEERTRDIEARAGAAIRDAQQRASEAKTRADRAEATVSQRAEHAEQVAQQRVEHAVAAAREHREAAERWAADIQRQAQQEVADAHARATEANATVDRRSAEAQWWAEQRVEAGRQEIQRELSGLRRRAERLRRTVVALAGVAVLMVLATVVLGWLALGSTTR